MKTESDYIQLEHDLSQAMGLRPAKFDRAWKPVDRQLFTGVWISKDGAVLPAWMRDGAATFRVMTQFQCYPSASNSEEIFIQSGIDLDCVLVPVKEHPSYELAVRYAVCLAATSIANSKHF